MIYRFRATIAESRIFYKVYDVKPRMTLFDLHQFLLSDLVFAPDQMVFFEGCDEKGNVCSQYCLFDMGDGPMDRITLESAVKKGEVELHYVFDMRNDRFLKLVFEGEEAESPKTDYPDVSEEKGQNPDQFKARPEEPEEYHPLPHPAKGEPGSEDDEDDDDDLDDDDEEEDDDDEREELLVDEDFGKQQ